ncbi:MAG: hypothetical protein Q8M81_12495 [Sediminibacterium sp.]|nr:hypothetical protein [Sediminibacterium sp.]
MKHFVLAMAILFTVPLFSQSTLVSLDTARAMLSRNEAEKALPVFQQLMTGTDAATQRAIVNELTELWVNGKGGIALSKANLGYGKLLSDYMNAALVTKGNNMSAADHYTAGMIFWAFGYSGASNQVQKAVNQLDAAARGGNTDALFYLAEAVRTLKNKVPVISWGDILGLYTRASEEKKTPRPLITLGNTKLSELSLSYMRNGKTAADLDTAKNVFWMSLNNLAQTVPDSFHVAVNYFWGRAFGFDKQDTTVSNLMSAYFSKVAIPVTSPAKKGVAWHYLELFFYDNSPKHDTTRARVMKALKTYYNNDRELLGVISEFLLSAEPNIMGHALSINSKWLSYFTPMQVADPTQFFRAAAATEQDFISFLEKNPSATQYTKDIAQGYRDRFNILFDIISGKTIDPKTSFALGGVASSISKFVIDKLSAFPEIRNSSAIKYAYADMAVLDNLSNYGGSGFIPVGFNQLPAAFANWSVADKQGYKTHYLDYLLKNVQQMVTSGKNTNALAQATGKSNPDLTDYDKAQATIDKIRMVLKTN